MAKFSYGIGNTLKNDDRESIVEIPANRTLYVQKLTNDDNFNPEVIHNLKSTDEVFEHFKPSCSVTFETENNGYINENFKFRSIEDFNLENIKKKSIYLSRIAAEITQYNLVSREIKHNKHLQSVVADPKKKKAVIKTLSALITELDEANK